MKSFHLSLGAALLAAGVAQAASVELYGTVDTGLLYTHESIDQSYAGEKSHENNHSWGLVSGTNTSSVIGLRGSEIASIPMTAVFLRMVFSSTKRLNFT